MGVVRSKGTSLWLLRRLRQGSCKIQGQPGQHRELPFQQTNTGVVNEVRGLHAVFS